MSGILGFWNPDGRPASVEDIARMSDAIAHRGPDGRPRIVDGPAALGYVHLETRTKPLPIIQPFTDPEAGLIIVLDGRIDNRKEVESALELQGLPSRSGSDAELILRSYQAWGVESPARLLGDFAFAIWDSRNQRFFCARDQLGVKPFLYFYSSNSLFAFGSEIQGIIALDRVPRRLNEFRLADYLVNELDREDTVGTFYQGIQRLPGGHCLLAERDSVKVWDYWKLVPKEGPRYRSMEECGEAFRSVFMTAVSARTRNTERIAYALSGGLDSSSVVATARELAGGAGQANLTTFSLIDPATPAPLEMIVSMVDQGGINSHLVRPEDVKAENYDLPSFIRKSDQPFEVEGDWFDRITYRAAREQGCDVLMGGVDGDQVHSFSEYLSFLIRRGRWIEAIRDGKCLSEEWKVPAWKILGAHGLVPIFPKAMRALGNLKRTLRKPSADGELYWIDEGLARRTRVAERRADRRRVILNAAHDPWLLHSLSFTAGWVSFILEAQDKNAGLLALELRHPFADRRVAEFLISLPVERKLYFPASKGIIRTAMRGLLPETLLRQSALPHPNAAFKARILDCHIDWFYASLERMLHSGWGYVNIDVLRRIQREYRSEKRPNAVYALWNIAVLADWIGVKGFGG